MCCTHLSPISQEVLTISIGKMILKHILLELLQHPSGTNELTLLSSLWVLMAQAWWWQSLSSKKCTANDLSLESLIIFGSGNGLSPVGCHAISWSNAHLLSVRHPGTSCKTFRLHHQRQSGREDGMLELRVWRVAWVDINKVIMLIASWERVKTYRKISNIRRTKSQNLNDSHLVLQLSLPNPIKPGVKSRMKM